MSWFTQVESEGRSYRATPAANRAWTSAPGAGPFPTSRAPGQRAAPSCLTGRRFRRCAAQRALPGQPRERSLHSFSSSLPVSGFYSPTILSILHTPFWTTSFTLDTRLT
ncbi:hypothetical protein C2E23DRAFT_831816 [Lenzites betulinus]|nr:hypothetical protein C2E23DRAFT_831816 [Lenzites betulinus]